MKPESIFHRFLRRIGLIKEGADDISFKQMMCEKAVKSNICPESCSSCAWNTKEVTADA